MSPHPRRRVKRFACSSHELNIDLRRHIHADRDNCVCSYYLFNPLPNIRILDCSKLKEFANDNSKFVEYDGKFSKRTENTVGKGELLITSIFSFSCSVFKRLVLQTHINQGLFGKGLMNKFLTLKINITYSAGASYFMAKNMLCYFLGIMVEIVWEAFIVL